MEFWKEIAEYGGALALTLIGFFYTLIEKRINARKDEEVRLSAEIQALRERVIKAETTIEMLKDNQSVILSDLKSFIASEIRNITSLFDEKIKHK